MDVSQPSRVPDPHFQAGVEKKIDTALSQRVQAATEATRDWLIARQHADGHWRGELEGDTILESEYILLLAWLGQEQSPIARKCAAYLVEKQLSTGGWSMYPGGKLEISG